MIPETLIFLFIILLALILFIKEVLPIDVTALALLVVLLFFLNGLGYLPMVRAAELAVAKAKSAGVGMVVTRPIGHYGSAGHYARICMENGCVGFSVQGYIGQFDLGYSAIEIDASKARSAVNVLAEKIAKSTEETAQAIVDIAVSGMYMEISKLISRYAVDPREFALQAFGGAGPMMACFVAKELGMETVIIPTAPGVLSALGGLIADIKNDFIKTVFIELGPTETAFIQEEYKGLEDQALRRLREEQAYKGDYRII